MAKLIKNWDELRQMPNESETHILEVGEYNAWLRCKCDEHYDRDKDWYEQLPHLSTYLSTHTFYGSQYKDSTKILQKCGFDVELANWDEKVK